VVVRDVVYPEGRRRCCCLGRRCAAIRSAAGEEGWVVMRATAGKKAKREVGAGRATAGKKAERDLGGGGAATRAAARKKAERDLGRGGGVVPLAVGKKVREIVGILGRSQRREFGEEEGGDRWGWGWGRWWSGGLVGFPGWSVSGLII
jgi:hypothetical protein